MKYRNLLPLVLLSCGFGSLTWASDQAQEDLMPAADASVMLEEAEQLTSCFDSYDCIRTVEHCLNRRCERTSRRCHFNYECGGADTCRGGICRR